MEREMLISSLWYPLTGCMGMIQSCVRGASDLTFGSIYLPERVVNHCSMLPREVVSALSPVSV